MKGRGMSKGGEKHAGGECKNFLDADVRARPGPLPEHKNDACLSQVSLAAVKLTYEGLTTHSGRSIYRSSQYKVRLIAPKRDMPTAFLALISRLCACQLMQDCKRYRLLHDKILNDRP